MRHSGLGFDIIGRGVAYRDQGFDRRRFSTVYFQSIIPRRQPRGNRQIDLVPSQSGSQTREQHRGRHAPDFDGRGNRRRAQLRRRGRAGRAIRRAGKHIAKPREIDVHGFTRLRRIRGRNQREVGVVQGGRIAQPVRRVREHSRRRGVNEIRHGVGGAGAIHHLNLNDRPRRLRNPGRNQHVDLGRADIR